MRLLLIAATLLLTQTFANAVSLPPPPAQFDSLAPPVPALVCKGLLRLAAFNELDEYLAGVAAAGRTGNLESARQYVRLAEAINLVLGGEYTRDAWEAAGAALSKPLPQAERDKRARYCYGLAVSTIDVISREPSARANLAAITEKRLGEYVSEAAEQQLKKQTDRRAK